MNTVSRISNTEYEEAVLGAILLENNKDNYSYFFNMLDKEDFLSSICSQIFVIFKNMYEKEYDINLVSFNNEIEILKDEISPKLYDWCRDKVLDITKFIPSTANAMFYAKHLKKYTEKRKILYELESMTNNLYEVNTEFDDILFDTMKKLNSYTTDKTSEIPNIKDDIGEMLDYLNNIRINPKEYTATTGYQNFDDIMTMRKGNLIILGARPSIGKTTFMLNLMLNMIKRGKRCAFISLEMPLTDLLLKLCSCYTGTSVKSLENEIDLSNLGQNIIRATNFLLEKKVYIYRNRKNIRRLYSDIVTLNRERGIDVIYIDYLQLVDPPTTKNQTTQNRNLELGQMTRELKLLALELNIIIFIAVQLNRQIESRTDPIPKLSDIRDSGAIEQDADSVLFLSKDVVEQMNGYTECQINVTIAKQRNGLSGKTLPFMFYKSKNKFEEIEE